MTDPAMNRAVAELCPGIAYINDDGDYCWGKWPQLHYFHPSSDLNCIHEVEKTLESNQIAGTVGRYAGLLWQTMGESPESEIGTIHATARQRTIAFLKLHGKYEAD